MKFSSHFYAGWKDDLDALQRKIVRYLVILWHNRITLFRPTLFFILFITSLFLFVFIFNQYERLQQTYMESFEEHEKLKKSSLDLMESSKDTAHIKELFIKKQFHRPIKNVEGQQTLEKIKRQLHFISFNLNAESDKVIDKKHLLYSKKITITIQSETDRKFYQLIDRLYHQMPGIIKFNKFSIKKSEPDSKTKNLPLFEGKIECFWIRQKSY
jgi:hypothetical protein